MPLLSAHTDQVFCSVPLAFPFLFSIPLRSMRLAVKHCVKGIRQVTLSEVVTICGMSMLLYFSQLPPSAPAQLFSPTQAAERQPTVAPPPLSLAAPQCACPSPPPLPVAHDDVSADMIAALEQELKWLKFELSLQQKATPRRLEVAENAWSIGNVNRTLISFVRRGEASVERRSSMISRMRLQMKRMEEPSQP